MANEWADEEITPVDGKFLRVKGGTTVDIHILDEAPVKLKLHFMNGKRTDCPGDNCELCANGTPVKERWAANVYEHTIGRVFVCEFPVSVRRQIKEIAQMLAEDGQTVDDVDFRIKAEGSGIETRYTVLQRPKKAVPVGLNTYSIP